MSMIPWMNTVPVFRFAPSPNGALHLGHAYSALLNLKMARSMGGRMLLRIEDIDTVRCTQDKVDQMLRDLEWIGFEWDDEPLRQSERFDIYRDHAATLKDGDWLYPSTISRAELKNLVDAAKAVGRSWPHDPDGAPLPPARIATQRSSPGEPCAWRLDTNRATASVGRPLIWQETGFGPQRQTGTITASPLEWGDCIVVRKDIPTSYHLSCIVDDALQSVTHVVRGADLFHATSIHVLLQAVLGLPTPIYHHHGLVMADATRKLSKSLMDTSLQSLRESGLSRNSVIDLMTSGLR